VLVITGSRLNTGTFTRPKKSKDKTSPTETADTGADIVEPIQHPNVADIENMAKMQEESLRQSIAHSSPRRGSVTWLLHQMPSCSSRFSYH